MDSTGDDGIGFWRRENVEEPPRPGAMGTSFLRAETRSVLCRNRIELSLLRVGVHGNVIRLQGILRRSAELPDLTHEALEGLEREIRRIPGVKRVEMLLSNWWRQDSEWRPMLAAVPETVELGPQAVETQVDRA